MWQYTYSDELYHFGVKGMKWGHRKKVPMSDVRSRYVSAKKTKRQAHKEYSKAFDKAYNYSNRHPISQFGKGKHRAESDRRWADAGYKAEASRKAATEYKQANKEYKQSDEYKAKRAKAIKIGAAAAGTALAAYGAYKVHDFVRNKNFEIAKQKGQEASANYMRKYGIQGVSTGAFTNGKNDVSVVVGSGKNARMVTKTFNTSNEAGKYYDRVSTGMINSNANARKAYRKAFDATNDVSFTTAAKNVYDDYKKKRRK